jgi:hypothetical protein
LREGGSWNFFLSVTGPFDVNGHKRSLRQNL